MLHIIRVPANCVELPPLAAVAVAMARSAATAGGTPFHRPTFDGKLAAFERRLVADARAGRLPVRDQDGGIGTVDEIVERAKDDGTYSEVLAHAGGSADIDKTASLVLYVGIPELNDWGAAAGDTFSVDSNGVEWIDERGVVTPPSAERSTGVVDAMLERVLTWTINGILHSRAAWAAGAREELRRLGSVRLSATERAGKLAEWLEHRADHYDKTDPASADQMREARGKLLPSLTQKTAPSSPALSSQSAPPAEAVSRTVHRLERQRNHPLDAVIERARHQALNAEDYQSVWAELVRLAEAKDRPAPLFGFCEEGIQYTGNGYQEKEWPDIFTKNALRQYMKRRAATGR